MPKFTAVMGKSKTNRIVSVEAPSEDRARYLIYQQLRTNSQRRQICDQWVADGEHIIEEAEDNGDEGAPTPLTATEAMAELQEHRANLVAMIESAREQIAEAVETLRAVANETDDLYRATHMVANLEALVSTGGWMALPSETLDGWVEELQTGEEV